MPSENQNNSDGNDYRNEAHRILSSGMNPRPMIRGIDDKDRAIMYWNEANRLDCGQHIKKVVKEQLQQFKD